MNKVKPFALAILVMSALAGCGAEESAERYFNRGMELYETGDLVKAKLEFRNALQIDGKNSQAWLMVGQIEEKETNWSQAFGAYSKAVELDPENAPARAKRGLLLLAGNDTAGALVEAEAVLSSNPRDPEALVLRSAINNRLDKRDEAFADVREALAIAPNHREGLILLGQIELVGGDAQAAIAATEQAIAAYPKDTELLLMLGGIYESIGQPNAAIDVLRKIVEIEPTVITHRQRLAGYLGEQGEQDEAIRVLRDSISLDPENEDAKLALVRFVAEQRSLADAGKEIEQMLAVTPNAAKLQFALAELQANSGNLDGARRIYEQVIKDSAEMPAGSEGRWRLAMLAMSEGKTDEAVALASEVLADDPNNEQALLIRGAIALERDDAEQVIADARTVVKNKPDSVDALRLLAQGHLKKQEFALAQDALSSAIKVAPDQPASYLELARVRVASGDLDGALATLEALLEKIPENADAQNAIAQIQLGQQDWASLETSSKRILDSSPDHPIGHYLQGLLLQRQGDLDGAIKAFQQALDRAPGAVEPLLALARAYGAQGRFGEAEAAVRKLLVENPNNISASGLLAEILEADSRPTEAIGVYEEIIRFNPQAPSGYLGLARLQERQEDNAGAIATLRKGIDATSRNDFMLFTLAIMLQKAQQMEEAAAVYEEVLASNPGADVVANNLAMLLLAGPDASHAQRERALELASRFENSEQAVFLDTLGWAQYQLGRYDLAAGTLNRALKAGQPFSEVQYHLGMTYLKLGRNAEATELLQSALGTDTAFEGSEEAKVALGSISVAD